MHLAECLFIVLVLTTVNSRWYRQEKGSHTAYKLSRNERKRNWYVPDIKDDIELSQCSQIEVKTSQQRQLCSLRKLRNTRGMINYLTNYLVSTFLCEKMRMPDVHLTSEFTKFNMDIKLYNGAFFFLPTCKIFNVENHLVTGFTIWKVSCTINCKKLRYLSNYKLTAGRFRNGTGDVRINVEDFIMKTQGMFKLGMSPTVRMLEDGYKLETSAGKVRVEVNGYLPPGALTNSQNKVATDFLNFIINDASTSIANDRSTAIVSWFNTIFAKGYDSHSNSFCTPAKQN